MSRVSSKKFAEYR